MMQKQTAPGTEPTQITYKVELLYIFCLQFSEPFFIVFYSVFLTWKFHGTTMLQIHYY